MKTLLLDVIYTDNTDRFWHESNIKKKKIKFNPLTENIHEVIKELCEEQDGMELTYNGKPQGNIFQDVLDKDGNKDHKTVGYMYRGRSEIYDGNMIKSETGLFDVWVTISEIISFTIDELN